MSVPMFFLDDKKSSDELEKKKMYLHLLEKVRMWYDRNNKMNPGYFSLVPLPWNRNKYLCFYIFPLEFGGVGDLHTHQNRRVLC